MSSILEQLVSMQDTAYRDFQASLLPTVPPRRMIGVRVPRLRKLARKLAGSAAAEHFLEALPHTYYEEDLLHAFLVEKERNFDTCIAKTERFLPYVDNWGVCDSFAPKVFSKHKQALLPLIDRWLSSSHPYTVRFGIKQLMTHFLDADFDESSLEKVAAVRSEEYYVNMMAAWYLATALAKQPAATLPYLEEHRLSPWVHAKTVRKAIESYRISPEMKAYLRTL